MQIQLSKEDEFNIQGEFVKIGDALWGQKQVIICYGYI